jgi:3-isopropylmalate dehydrogenase
VDSKRQTQEPKKRRIAVIPGDGIGQEVIPQAVKVIQASGADVELTDFDWGADRYLRDQTTVPADGFAMLGRDFDAILVGAFGDPRVKTNIHAKEILLGMRFKMDLYANVRPVRLLDAALCPLKGIEPKDVDFVVLRENTEGVYTDAGGVFKQGTPDEIATQEDINTRKGVERIIRYAFQYCERHTKIDGSARRRVLMCDKSNAMTHAGGLWQRVFKEVSGEYPQITAEHMYVDALCMQMVRDPRQFDVIATNNMFGDIITDLAAGLQGGLGMAASGNIHPGRTSMFEPVHGSAPPIAGKNMANPFGAILTGAMMLTHLGMTSEAARIEGAVLEAVRQKKTTQDIGGMLGTREAGEWVAKAVAAQTDLGVASVSNPNELNTQKGKGFQIKCAASLRAMLGEDFELEVPVSVGVPKLHKFDLASKDRSTVVECKAFCWTRPDYGIPVAKITTLKEAVQYLKSVPKASRRILIVQRDLRPRTGETLACYFVRLNKDALGDVIVLEMPLEGDHLTCVHGTL